MRQQRIDSQVKLISLIQHGVFQIFLQDNRLGINHLAQIINQTNAPTPGFPNRFQYPIIVRP